MTSFFKKLVNKPKEDEKKPVKTGSGKEPSSPGGPDSKSPKLGVPKRRNSTSSSAFSAHDTISITMADLAKMVCSLS